MSNFTQRFLPILAMVCLATSICNAQFGGGSDDGSHVSYSANQNLGRNIFIGGTNDGIALALTGSQNLGRNIFIGGTDDGFVFGLSSTQNLGRNIFIGGVDDGFKVTLNGTQNLGRNIFIGGTEDGSIVGLSGSQNLGRNIFIGGANDGWAMAFAANLPLPVTLADFSGKWQQNDALLYWETVTEINSDHFELERSFDGINFTSVKILAAAGQSSAVNKYAYTDAGIKLLLPPNTATIYYRLRTVDKDGKGIYSGIVILKIAASSATQYAVFPNPAKDFITVSVNGLLPNNTATIRLSDISGKVLLVQKLTSDKQQVLLSNYISGTYFLQVLADGKVVYTQKIIINK